ncbi:MAG: UDP-N-acetylmuramate dehydrogenase [Leptospiraceae bacterium]|nr:UDP-N-acetylmuramate dehydrogenase [Leptospiraceae bacterium]MCP5497398.1 UDP-N-acetylmuramate dehydrogenase [Leptospiraceae bacterium]
MVIPIQELIFDLSKNKVNIQRDQPLSKFSSFKIGGVSPLVIEPASVDDLVNAVCLLSNYSLPYKLLGGGTNILISDTPDDFAVIRLSGTFKDYNQISDSSFYIGAAANTTPVFRNISLMGYTGLEFLSTIPGSVGGAVIQNAGCYGGEFFNVIQFVDVLKKDKVIRLAKSDIDYGYRWTQFLQEKDSIILGIEIQTEKGDLETIELSLKEKREKRKASQPENRKSAGSVFKNPKIQDESGKEIKSWELIDKVNLRGMTKGDAEISQKHCNFIINNGNAKASDVHFLIELVKERVYNKFGITLEKEIEYFGKIN